MARFWFFALLVGPVIALVAAMNVRVLLLAWGDRGNAQWPTVAGRVTGVEITSYLKRSMHDGQGAHRRYTLRVWYRYTVDGEDFRATQLWQERHHIPPFPGDDEVFGGRYTDGQTVTVYHHPTKPARSLLEPHSASRRDALTTASGSLGAMIFAAVAIALIMRFV